MVTIIPTDSSEGDFGVVQIRREEAKSSVWEIVAAKPTMSNIAQHRVCLQCASQNFIYENFGNYLKNVWLCQHWRQMHFREENWNFRNSNIANLGVPLFWGVLGTLEISIMRLYLDRPLPFRPKMLAVDAHLYRLLSPQI